jgi:tape measure domain-containing protein
MLDYAGKDLFDELSRVADVSGAFNITADNAKEMVRQMSQVDQATVAYTQDLDILQNQGIPIFKAIASELGINVAGVRKMASEGKISSDIYNKAFNSIAATVKGASNTQSQTFKGMLSTLGDDYKILMGALTKPIFDHLKQELTSLMPILDGFVSLTRGDFKDFTEHLNQAFGKDTGGKIISFVQGAQQAFQSLEGYVNRGKQAIKGIFDIFKGNMAEGNGILKSIGLSDDTVRLIDGYISNVKTEILGFGKWVTSTFTSLFSGNNDLGSSFSKIFNTAKSIALPILTDIVNFTRDSIKRIQEFWDKDGDKIIQSVKDSIKMLSDTFEALKPV